MPTALRQWGSHYWPYALLAFAILVAYGNVYDNAFLFDDDLIIKINTYLRDWSHLGDILTSSTTAGAHINGGFYRPIQILIYWLIYQIGGYSTFWFHVPNITLHIINACLAYRLAEKFEFPRMPVLCGLLLWAVHPLHVEAISYISGTADPLYLAFWLTALVYMAPDFSQKKIFQTFPLFLLAMLSKESASIFPALLCVCIFVTSPNKWDWKTYIRTWPHWLLAIAYMTWRIQAAQFDGPASYAHMIDDPSFTAYKLYSQNWLLRLLTFFATLPAYAELLVWPHDLHMERAFRTYTDAAHLSIILGALLCLLALFILYRQRHQTKSPLSFAFLWFGICHLPNTGLLFAVNAVFLEHWMYAPTLGLLMGGFASLPKTFVHYESNNGKLMIGLTAVLACVLTYATWQQNLVWHDPESFYLNIFKHGATTARAHNNLAMYYSDKGEFDKAITEYNQALKESDVYAETHYNLALVILRQSQGPENLQQAITHLQRSIEINPLFYRSYLTLSQIFNAIGQHEKAEEYNAKAKRALAGQAP